jgi:GNAT superfamily N-acetyltransferase
MTIAPVRVGHEGLIQQLIGIYESSVAASGRKPVAQFRAFCGDPSYRVEAALAGAEVAGFAIWFIPPAEPFALLEYLAVAEAHRGAGVGSTLVKRRLADAQRTVIAEVESECAEGDPSEQQRRIGFYRRLGFQRVVGLAYQLPLRVAGIPPPMDLFLHRPDPPTPLPRRTLRRWVQVIYTRVYAQDAADPRIEQMMRPVDDPVGLE